MILNKAKDYHKNNKDKLKQLAKDKYNIPEEKIKKINIKKCLKKKRMKEENMEETDIATCLKKKKIKKQNMQEIDITQ